MFRILLGRIKIIKMPDNCGLVFFIPIFTKF